MKLGGTEEGDLDNPACNAGLMSPNLTQPLHDDLSDSSGERVSFRAPFDAKNESYFPSWDSSVNNSGTWKAEAGCELLLAAVYKLNGNWTFAF